MPTLLLDGELTAATPIAIVLPGTEGGRTPAGAPRKRLMQDGVMVETIYVPPSSLRGRLRHLLTNELMRQHHGATGHRFTPDDYIASALGGVKDRKAGGDDGREIDLKRIAEVRRRNPIVSMFGSMATHVSGRLMVGDMTPLEPVAPQPTGRSVRANPFVRDPAVIELLDPAKFDEFMRRNALRVAANKAEDEAKRHRSRLDKLKRGGAPKEEIAAAQQEIDEKEAEANAGFAEAGGAVNLQQPLDGYDVLPEGTVLKNRIRLMEGTEPELALVLLALDLLAKRPVIGGHTAHGCGEIAGAWTARLRDADALHEAGQVRIEPFAGLVLEDAAPPLEAALKRARAFADEVHEYDFSAA